MTAGGALCLRIFMFESVSYWRTWCSRKCSFAFFNEVRSSHELFVLVIEVSVTLPPPPLLSISGYSRGKQLFGNHHRFLLFAAFQPLKLLHLSLIEKKKRLYVMFEMPIRSALCIVHGGFFIYGFLMMRRKL